MSRRLNIVVAACDNMGIGIEGRVPWHIKKDMHFFKHITMTTQQEEKRNAVIMGRKTWESIPSKYRPLEDRLNIILSANLTEAPPGTVLANNLSNALKEADKNGVEGVFIIGGSSVYQEAMKSLSPLRLFYTRVEGSFDCDTFLSPIDPNVFKRVDSPPDVPSGKFEENGITFSFEVYEKA